MNFRGRVIFLFLTLAAGFSGGVLAQLSFAPSPAMAGSGQSLSANSIYIQDAKGKQQALFWGQSNGGGMISLMGPDGKQRIQLGSYDGSYSKSEKGLPLIGFSDNQGGLRMLFRLAGSNESPVLVFKDRKHRDRMVIGLSLNGNSEEPFIAFFDKSGKKHLLMGAY
jgi:hypothetical protein